MTDLQKEKIVAMREQKATYAAISETIGIPIGTIKAFCHRNSLTTETPKGKPCCKNCGGEFYIKWQKIIITQHVGNEYFLLCPHCKTIGWCVKQPKK